MAGKATWQEFQYGECLCMQQDSTKPGDPSADSCYPTGGFKRPDNR